MGKRPLERPDRGQRKEDLHPPHRNMAQKWKLQILESWESILPARNSFSSVDQEANLQFSRHSNAFRCFCSSLLFWFPKDNQQAFLLINLNHFWGVTRSLAKQTNFVFRWRWWGCGRWWEATQGYCHAFGAQKWCWSTCSAFRTCRHIISSEGVSLQNSRIDLRSSMDVKAVSCWENWAFPKFCFPFQVLESWILRHGGIPRRPGIGWVKLATRQRLRVWDHPIYEEFKPKCPSTPNIPWYPMGKDDKVSKWNPPRTYRFLEALSHFKPAKTPLVA